MRHHPDCDFNWSGESETCNCTELNERDDSFSHEGCIICGYEHGCGCVWREVRRDDDED